MAKLSKKQIKTLEEIERRVNMTLEFMNDWLLFNQILSAYPSPGVNKAQLENQFLKIKSKLAREHNVLKEVLQSDYKIDHNTMHIVASATNLEAIFSQSEVSVKKLQAEWHRAFISINETLGGLEDKKTRAEAGQKIMIDPVGGLPIKVAGGGLSKGNRNFLIIIVVVAALAAVFFFTPLGDTYRDSFTDLFG